MRDCHEYEAEEGGDQCSIAIARSGSRASGSLADLIPARAVTASTAFEHITSTGVTMSFIAWIVLGLIAGFIASKLVNKSGEGMLLDIVLGIVGALVGGWLFNVFGMPGVSGLNAYSLLVAVLGAAVFLFVYHAVTRRRV
jgi:uncharacterized membrane protein YeaQ/YmgE (transglycosylase-associated protein family)